MLGYGARGRQWWERTACAGFPCRAKLRQLDSAEARSGLLARTGEKAFSPRGRLGKEPSICPAFSVGTMDGKGCRPIPSRSARPQKRSRPISRSASRDTSRGMANQAAAMRPGPGQRGRSMKAARIGPSTAFRDCQMAVSAPSSRSSIKRDSSTNSFPDYGLNSPPPGGVILFSRNFFSNTGMPSGLPFRQSSSARDASTSKPRPGEF